MRRPGIAQNELDADAARTASGILKNRLEASPQLPAASRFFHASSGSMSDGDADLDVGVETVLGDSSEISALTPTAAQIKDPNSTYFGSTSGSNDTQAVPPNTTRPRVAISRFSSDGGNSALIGGASRGILTEGAKVVNNSTRNPTPEGGGGRAARSLLAGAPAAGAPGAAFFGRSSDLEARRLRRSASRRGWLVGGHLSTVEPGDEIDGMKVDYAFYPGSGDCDCADANIVNVPVPPLWRESKSRSRKGTSSIPAKIGRLAARQGIEDRLVPALRAFGPDLVLISAGFDGGVGDIGNTRPDGKATGGMNLRPEDFAHITGRILDVARTCCPGKVVSVLEGGYGRYRFKETARQPERTIRTRRGGTPTSTSNGETPTLEETG